MFRFVRTRSVDPICLDLGEPLEAPAECRFDAFGTFVFVRKLCTYAGREDFISFHPHAPFDFGVSSPASPTTCQVEHVSGVAIADGSVSLQLIEAPPIEQDHGGMRRPDPGRMIDGFLAKTGSIRGSTAFQ